MITKSGIQYTIDNEANKITIARIKIGDGNDNSTVYEPITFFVENMSETDVAYLEFEINYGNYKKYIDPSDNSEYLTLVNHQNPMSSSYIPTDLVQLTCPTNPVNPDPSYYKLRLTAEKALSAMMQAMKNSNIDGIQVSSSYRSYERQVYLLENYIKSEMKTNGLSYEDAKKEVLKTLAIPGHSEHQTGLAVDFVQGTKSLTVNFEKTSSFAWLSKNAHKFGFILRYPSDKTDVTGYDYEPWHYRFVGRTVASRIYEAKLCYEEYIELTK
jgi:D-alanyl-D-alanine carboxypeptidase